MVLRKITVTLVFVSSLAILFDFRYKCFMQRERIIFSVYKTGRKNKTYEIPYLRNS